MDQAKRSARVDRHRFGPWAVVSVLGESLHVELGKFGVSVTVLLPGATATEMVRPYGIDATTMNRLLRPMRLGGRTH